MIRILVLLGLLICSAVAAASPAALPAPDGPYAVGMQRFELTDTARRGVLSEDANEPRVLPGYVWYPAKAGTPGTRPYFTPAEVADQARSMTRNFEYGAADLDGLGEVIAHSTEGAAPAPARERFPILIFNHGYECYPAQNSALLEQLASHGYIVISIAHPHDAVDLRLADGTLLKTSHPSASDAQFSALKKTLSSAPTHEARTAALKDFGEALSHDKLGASFVAWRDDLVFTARAIEAHRVPSALGAVLKNGNTQQLGFIGMSFGGATAASSCRLVKHCRVAINFDGGNYDPVLFNAPVQRPLLLLMSDWIHLPLPNRLSDPEFNPNDYAYETWSRAGLDPNVVRVRVDGIRHMGFTDLILLMDGPEHEARFGTVEPRVAVDSISAVSLAFLNQYLKRGSRSAFDAAIKSSPVLKIHEPLSVRRWAASTSAGIRGGRGRVIDLRARS